MLPRPPLRFPGVQPWPLILDPNPFPASSRLKEKLEKMSEARYGPWWVPENIVSQFSLEVLRDTKPHIVDEVRRTAFFNLSAVASARTLSQVVPQSPKVHRIWEHGVWKAVVCPLQQAAFDEQAHLRGDNVPFWIKSKAVPSTVKVTASPVIIDHTSQRRLFNLHQCATSGTLHVPLLHYSARSGLPVQFSKTSLRQIVAQSIPACPWVARKDAATFDLPAGLFSKAPFQCEMHSKHIVVPLDSVSAADRDMLLTSYPPPPPNIDSLYLLCDGLRWREFPLSAVLTTGFNTALPRGFYLDVSVAQEFGFVRRSVLYKDLSELRLLVFEALVAEELFPWVG